MSDQPISSIIGGRVATYECDQRWDDKVLSVVVEKDGALFEIYAYDDEGRAALYVRERESARTQASREAREAADELTRLTQDLGLDY